MAEGPRGIRVLIEAVDRISRPFRSMADGVRGIVSRLGLEQLRDRFGAVTAAVRKLGSEVVQMAKAAAIGTTVLAGALGAVVKRVADAGAAVQIGAQRTGLSIKAYQQLGYAAEQSGSNIDELADGIKDFSQKVVDAASGNKDLASAFQRMGVALKDAHGNLRPTEDILLDVADAFAKVPDGAKKSAAAMVLMGDAGVRLIPFLDRGRKGIQELGAEAERLGVVMDEETAAKLKALDDDLGRLGRSVEGTQNAIAAKLLPTIQPLVRDLTAWVTANQALIATKVDEAVKALPGIIASARDAFDSWRASLQPVIDLVSALVEHVGGFNAITGTAAAIIAGKLLTVLAPLMTALVALTQQFVLLGAGIGRLVFAPVIAAIGTFVTAIASGSGVMAAFNAVLAANPIGLVIIAIAALGAAAYAIYANWGPIAAWFGKLWQTVRAAFTAFTAWVAGAFAAALDGAWSAIQSAAAAVADFLSTLWGSVQSAFSAFAGWVSGVFTAALDGAWNALRSGAAAYGDFLSTLWGPVRKAFAGFAAYVGGVFTGDVDGALSGLRTIGSAVQDLFSALWAPVKRAFAAFAGWVGNTFGVDLKAAIDAVWNLVRPIIDAISTAIGGIGKSIDAVKGAAAGVKAWVFGSDDAAQSPPGATSGAGSSPDGAGSTAGGPERVPGAPRIETMHDPIGSGGRQEVDAGGTIAITLDDRRTSVKARMNNPNIRAEPDLTAGAYGVTQ